MGVTCRRCNCKEHYWLENKQAYECKRCQARQTLRSGTVMQHSNLPYRYWFVAMHLLTATGSFPPPRYSDSRAQALPAHMGNGQ